MQNIRGRQDRKQKGALYFLKKSKVVQKPKKHKPQKYKVQTKAKFICHEGAQIL